MSTDVAVATTTDPDRGKWGARSIVALVLFIIATLLTPIALIGHWGQRTVFDTERYLATVGPLVQQPEIQAALSTSITDAVTAKLDTQTQVESLLGGILPSQVSGLANTLSAPIASGINGLISDLVKKFIASPEFEQVWLGLNQTAQQGMVALLEGRPGGPVSLQGDNVVLDVSTALTAIQQHLVDSGITVAGNVTIPDVDKQVVLMQAPALAQARFIYSLTSPILSWLPLLTVLLFALAIILSRHRARVVVATGIVLVVTALLLAIGLSAGQVSFKDQLSSTPFGPAADAFWTTLFAYLVGGIQAILVLGIVLILAGWFGGRSKYARLLRGHVVAGLNDLGSRMPAGLRSFGAIVHQYQEWIRWAIYAIGAIILLTSGLLIASTVLWVVALVAGLITLAQLLAGAGSAAESEGTGTRSIAPPAPLTNA